MRICIEHVSLIIIGTSPFEVFFGRAPRYNLSPQHPDTDHDEMDLGQEVHSTVLLDINLKFIPLLLKGCLTRKC